jgi:membrane-associated phospholipid phosphatase
MREVAAIMAQSPEQAIHRGAVLLGGVSAMPSLHVAMVAVTAFWLAMAKRWTLYITGPWVLLVWTSTVVLGWHYVLDGAGGILLAVLCAVLTSRSLASLGLGFPGSSGATESIERSRFRGALPRHGNQ